MAFQQDAYQLDAFQQPQTAFITQVIPSFTQSGTATSEAVTPPEPDIDHVEFVLFMVFGPIRQTMPAFTQHLEANVNDDELVLLLI